MSTVRFTQVVEKCGHPEVYLLLTKPADDPTFQKALKADRVMTVQSGKGGADHGVVGYEPNPGSQILVFPRALKNFAGANVVGIKYELLHEEHGAAQPPESAPATKKMPKITAFNPDRPVPRSEGSNQATRKTKVAMPSASKPAKKEPTAEVLKFPERPPAAEPVSKSSKASKMVEVPEAKVKADVRRALKALQEGKQVLAYQILEKILESSP